MRCSNDQQLFNAPSLMFFFLSFDSTLICTLSTAIIIMTIKINYDPDYDHGDCRNWTLNCIAMVKITYDYHRDDVHNVT